MTELTPETLDELDRGSRGGWKAGEAYDYLAWLILCGKHTPALVAEVRRLSAENFMLSDQIHQLRIAVMKDKSDPVEAFRQLREISGDHWDGVDVEQFMRDHRGD